MTFRELVECLGGHAAASLDIDLETSEGLARWLLVAALGSGRGGDSAAPRAYQALQAVGVAAPGALAESPLGTTADVLAGAGIAKPDVLAVLLQQLATTLCEAPDRLERAAREAEDLATLGAQLTRLAPGFGPTAAARFLRPLRDRFAVVDDLPLAREAAAAAVHLGWLDPDADLEFAAGTLRAVLRHEADAPDFRDIEAALERLGRTSCARRRAPRCPLAERCPALDSRSAADVASSQASD